MASSFCVNHPSRAAGARCHTCHKPLCDECAIKEGANTFCSARCREGHEKFYAKYPDEGGGSFLRKLKSLVLLAVALAVIAGALYAGAKIFKIEFCVELLKKVGL